MNKKSPSREYLFFLNLKEKFIALLIMLFLFRCQCITDFADSNFLAITCHFQKIKSKVLQNFIHNRTKSLTIICADSKNATNEEFEENMFKNFSELQELKISVFFLNLQNSIKKF